MKIKSEMNKLKKKMVGTCFGSLAYCCGLKKTCPGRDTAIKEVGITKKEYKQLKDKFDKNLLEIIHARSE